jgi:uncharacterized protein involved in response to NO
MAVIASAMPSMRRLGWAPHRLLFFVGAGNLLLAMAWWAAWLVGQRFPAAATVGQPELFAGWLHAFTMQYQVLPTFMAGFLLTVFPRWMALPELPRWRYAPVGLGLLGGQAATLAGALGLGPGLLVGWLMTLAGWLALVGTLAPMLWRERGATWHARAIVMALAAGLAGLLLHGAFLMGGSPMLELASIKTGSFGLLLPVYLVVAHRMFPFFAGNVVADYQPWRPLWLLAAAGALLALDLVLELVQLQAWTWLPDLGLFALTSLMCWRWWPQGPMPGILRALFIGLAWLPLTFAFYSAQSLGYLATGVLAFGRAPAHALFIGFFGSVLVAMVTRVAQGHSGRPMRMPMIAWLAFAGIQVVAVLRILAELSADPLPWHAASAIGWLLVLGPWAARLGWIVLTPRIDGKPG